MMMQATIAWQIYDITHSKWQLGLIGLVQFIPAFFGLSLIGGAFADGHDRRVIAVACGGAGGAPRPSVSWCSRMPAPSTCW